MKLLLVRHGESKDDLINAYGGWADFPLTDRGKNQLKTTAEKINELDQSFEKILSSPLKRAKESAKVLSENLSIPFEVFEYVKERNTYGILSGMVKEEALEKYPWLVKAYKNDEYVIGSERIEDIENRAKEAYKLIKERNENNLIIVTHGNFLKAFLPVVVDKKVVKKEDGGFIFVDTDSSEVLLQNGIEVL